jgi:hypothetical protein
LSKHVKLACRLEIDDDSLEEKRDKGDDASNLAFKDILSFLLINTLHATVLDEELGCFTIAVTCIRRNRIRYHYVASHNIFICEIKCAMVLTFAVL